MAQKRILTEGPIGKQLFQLSVPMFFAMISFALFNFIDTKFVGQLGTDPLAALSYTVNTMLIMFALAFGLGTGVTATIGRAEGAGDIQKVKNLTTDSLMLAVVLAIILLSIGLPNIEPLFSLFGAQPELMPYINDYMRLWFIGVPFIIIPMVGNSAIRGKGNTLIPAIIMGVSIVANIILDYGLIFGNWGFPRLEMYGASLATLISRILTLIFSLSFLHFKFGMISMKGFSFNRMINSWKEVSKIGIPAIATQMIIPLSIATVSRIASEYPNGKQLVSTLQTGGRVDFFALAIIASLGGVLVPFIAQNYGAGKFDRIKKAQFISRRFAVIWGIAMMVLFMSVRKHIGPIFMKGQEDLIFFEMMGEFYWIIPMSFVFRMLFVIDTSSLNALQKPLLTGGVTLFQMIVLYVPLAYVLGGLFDYVGIFYGYAISCIIGGIVAYFVQNRLLNRLSKS